MLFHPLKKTTLLKQQDALFEEHGGLRLQMLTHDAEASASCQWINERFGAGIYVHSSDAHNLTARTRCPVVQVFSSRHRVADGLEAIPLSGHTPGFTAYRLELPEATFLFSGDFLSPTPEGWVARVRKLLMPVGVANLNALKNISFDAILPNMSKGPGLPPFSLTPKEREGAIDAAIARLTKKLT